MARHVIRSKRTNVLVAVLATAFALLVARPAAAEGPMSEGVPSFGESAGCGALDGVGGPRMGTTGFLPDSTPVRGPWGDFFGRTIGDIRSQLVVVHLPGQPKDLYIHERALPAFDMVLDNLAAEAAEGNTYTVTEYTWSFHPVTIPPTTKLSFHGVGASIDVNSHTNPYRADNVLITDMPAWFVDAWTEAGWCWGGDWQSIKDPMHYSWMGPIHTPGYDMSSAPPQPPKVAFSNYSNNAAFPEHSYDVVFDSGNANGAQHFAVDLDANGAADVVRLRLGAGGVVVLEASRARWEYTHSTDWASTTVAPTDTSAPLTLSDVTGDARPDIVYLLDRPGRQLSLEVFPLVQGGALTPITIDTAVPATPDARYLFDDFDMDGASDLYVVRPGAPGTIEVWRGPDFASAAVSVSAELPATSQYDTGDRDFDGTADLYVLGADGGLRIFIGDPADAGPFEQIGAISAAVMGLDPTGERFFVDDLDGDGHPDLLLVDADGQLRLRRGGFSTHAPGVWFVVESEVAPPPGPCPANQDCDTVFLVDASGRWTRRDSLDPVAGSDSFYFGNSGDVAFAGDWDGDGVDTPGLYRQSDGFVYLRNSNTQGVADLEFFFGNPGDVPIVGDFDGDGFDTVSIYRPSEGRFYIINELGQDGGGLGAADFSFGFGNVGDRPFVGDFDGDGFDSVGLHRAATGYVYLRNSLTTGVADLAFFFGNSGDVLVAGDWDGDGDDTVAVYRPSTGRFYFKLANAAGAADLELNVGFFSGVAPGR